MKYNDLNEKVNGIYLITNTVTGKAYVGKSKDVARRWGSHWYQAFGSDKSQTHLHRAMRKYGKDSWEFEVLEQTSDMIPREIFWIAKLGTQFGGYNMTGGGEGGTLGRPMPEETRHKISQSNTGKVRSEEARAKNAAAKKGKPLSRSHREKIGSSNKGGRRSEETKAKMSEAMSGKKFSEEHKAKLREAWERRKNRSI